MDLSDRSSLRTWTITYPPPKFGSKDDCRPRRAASMPCKVSCKAATALTVYQGSPPRCRRLRLLCMSADDKFCCRSGTLIQVREDSGPDHHGEDRLMAKRQRCWRIPRRSRQKEETEEKASQHYCVYMGSTLFGVQSECVTIHIDCIA